MIEELTPRILNKEVAIARLQDEQLRLSKVTTKEEAIAIIKETAKAVGYKPAVRVLMMGQAPEQAVHWRG